MKGMILAAGLGTRLRPYTDILPKPCIPLLNIPLGYFPLYHFFASGVTGLIVNTHHLPKKIEALYLEQSAKFKSLDFSHESPSILGSGGGIGHARHLLDDVSDFFVANADEVFLPSAEDTFQQLKGQHRSKKPLATLLVIKHPEVGTKFGGVWADKSGRVTGFGKIPTTSGSTGYHYTGFMILNRRVFDFIPKSVESNIFYDVLVPAIEAGEEVRVITGWGDWFETGNKNDLLHATRTLLELLPQNKVLQKIYQTFLPSFSLKSDLIREKGSLVLKTPTTQIHGTQSIHGFAVVGTNSSLGQNCSLNNVIIGNDVNLPDHSNLKNEIVLR